MDFLVAGLDWRPVLFDPGTHVLTFGAVRRRGTRQGISHFAVRRSAAAAWPEEPLLWPAAGQKEVPPLYMGTRKDVIPDAAADASGTAVTAHFPPGSALRGARMRLEDGRGREVEVRTSSPEAPFDATPASRKWWHRQTLALVPVNALRRKETYRARFSAEVTPAGEDPKPRKWERAWTFRTMEKAWDLQDRYAIEV